MSYQTQLLLPAVLLLACFGFAACTATYDDQTAEVSKRGGARPFYGFDMHGSKRISGGSPYYFYEKRGGGRAFVGGWNPSAFSGPMERRGGGRAFAGSWQPSDYLGRFYDAPYFHKRSGNLWEFLQSGNNNDIYRR